ncbi:ferroxidase HEPHL1-like isoform X1 [Alosa pseudoharengus]|uniref:ferroxidase HEPHL1-like isoform X1 n=1 Tax=Alosa pseudoharengus TaxID=34774 RepID=UPI003F8C2891
MISRVSLTPVALLLLLLPLAGGVTRTYYIGIREENWDYVPGQDGGEYLKALYRQYTDDSYTTEVPKPSWLGFLGPVIRAQVDDVIVVHLKNFAIRPYSIHPHGLFYKKDSEGALYPDNTSGQWKADDAVPPGHSHTYTWIVQSEFGPAEGDAPCLSWAYHSHVDAPKDIPSGLIGPLLTCRKGVLREESTGPQRSDVDAEFFLMFSAVDERLSWYHNGTDQELDDESNLKHSINGHMNGTLRGLSVCVGARVAWHLMGMGNEADVHSAHFYGHTLLERGHRRDVISVFPATFTTAIMAPMTTGKWMLSCQVNEHFKAGLQAFYQVNTCSSDDPISMETGGTERHYYIRAEEQEWDYAPLGVDTFTGKPLTSPDSDSEVFFEKGGGALGGRYLKARYVRYTDKTFTRRHASHSHTHLGILGPVIAAETGDTVVVTFSNNASRTYSIQPHGLQYDKRYEGAEYQDGVSRHGAAIAPGERFTYRWRVLEGPSPSDPPCQSYLYYSAHDPVKDTNSGLVGPLKICRKGELDQESKQRAVDKEFFLLFGIFDENLSWYLQDNIRRYGDGNTKPEAEFTESNLMHGVNGRLYGNLQGLEVCVGERVVWHTLGLGSQVDIHGVYFQGNVFRRHGNTRDTLSLFPHTSATVTMTTHRTGLFSVSCRTTDHFVAGMKQKYNITACGASTHTPSHTHTPSAHYFLSAEEVDWDYAPDRAWELEKHNITAEDSYGSVFVQRGGGLIGSRYKKVVFRQYTDASYTTRQPITAQDTHLGILGPILRLQVGEQVSVTFKNMASRHYSLHAHGVEPEPLDQSEAAPGEIRKYLWNVPERVGPGPDDPNCITYAYYSTANYVRDLASGLVGPLIVCRSGVLDDKRRRSDVDREFALLFMVFDENESWYLQDNIKSYANTHLDTNDENFTESNMMHSINGRLYGTLLGLDMQEGDKTDWYLLGLGNEVDMHTVHFHAHTFTYKEAHTHRADVFDLFPGTFQTVSLTAKHAGTWLLHCHVSDHIHAGMETTYTIHPRKTTAPGTGKTTLAPGTGDNERQSNSAAAEGSRTGVIAGVVVVLVLLCGAVILAVYCRRVHQRTAPPPALELSELEKLQAASTDPPLPTHTH